MIRGSDGLDYEDLTQRLLGNPLPTHRNNQIRSLEDRGKVRVFIEAYDRFHSALVKAEAEAEIDAEHKRSAQALDWGATQHALEYVRAYNRERRLVADGIRDPIASYCSGPG